MDGFDLASLLDMRPPRFLCKRCMAVWHESPKYIKIGGRAVLECGSCGIRYIPTEEFSAWRFEDYYTECEPRLCLDFKPDVLHHGRTHSVKWGV